MKKPIILLAIISIIIIASFSITQAYATTQVFGGPDGTSVDTLNAANTLTLNVVNMTAFSATYPATDPQGQYNVTSAYANIMVRGPTSGASQAAAKMVVTYTNHSIAAISDAVYPTQNTSLAWYAFNFSSGLILYDTEENYTLGIIANYQFDYGYNNNNGIGRWEDSTNSYTSPTDPTDGTPAATYRGHACYFILEFNQGTPTAAPLPTGGSYDTSDTNLVINTFVGYLIPLLLFLLPALILGWVTRWAKWPILIGLAIGSGLTYLFLGTQYLWLVVMVIIGIASMSYADFRSNG